MVPLLKFSAILPSLVLYFCAGTSEAQLTARALGLGGAYTALARGVHAADWNPANLGLPDNSRFSFTFVSAGASVNNNAFTKGLYDRYFVDGADADNTIYWSARDIEELLDAIPDGGLNLSMLTQIRTFSFSIGRFALSVASDAAASFSIDKSLLEIPLQGTRINKQYSFGDAGGRGLGYGAVGLSWGQPIPVGFADWFSVGATLHAFYGGGYASTNDTDIMVNLKPYGADIDAGYDLIYAYNSGRLGWGMDLGVAAVFKEKWTVGLSVANSFGSISWQNDVSREEGLFTADSVSVVTDFEEDFTDSTWTTELSSYSTRMPPVLKIGAVYREGRMLVAADYRQGFSENAFTGTNPQFSLGTEWAGISWLPLRAGVTLGGRTGFGSSFGFGIRPGCFVLDLAIMSRGGITPASSKGVAIAIDLGLDFAPAR